MPLHTKKPKSNKGKMYNKDDVYNVPKTIEEDKKVRPKDVFEGYKAPSKQRRTSKSK